MITFVSFKIKNENTSFNSDNNHRNFISIYAWFILSDTVFADGHVVFFIFKNGDPKGASGQKSPDHIDGQPDRAFKFVFLHFAF